jgi:hypothetical protein
MTGKFAFGVLAVTGALLIPGSTVGAGGFHGGGAAFSVHFAGPAGILRQPHAGPRMRSHFSGPHRFGTGPRFGAHAALDRDGDARRSSASHLSHEARRENPYSHIPRGHHRILFGGWGYPITTGDDWGYVGTSYDPDAAASPYRYTAPAIVNLNDPPAPQAAPRLSTAKDDNPDACRSERVTVPAREGDREITIIRC